MEENFVLAMVLWLFVLFVAPVLTGVGTKGDISPNVEIRLSVPQHEKISVSVSPEAAKYPQAWKKVFKNRSLSVPVNVTTRHEMRGLFHYTLVGESSKIITFNHNLNEIVVLKKGSETRSSMKFAWFILLGLLSILSMVVFNITFHKGIGDNVKVVVVALIVNVAFAFTFFAVAITTKSSSIAGFAVISALSSVFACVSVFAADANNERLYITSNIIFYLLMFLALVCCFN